MTRKHITLEEIDEAIKEMALKALENNTFDEIKDEIEDELRIDFPNLTQNHYDRAIMLLQETLPAKRPSKKLIEGEREIEESALASMKKTKANFSRKLGKHFIYGLRRMKYADLEEGELKVGDIQVQPNIDQRDTENFLDELEKYGEENNPQVMANAKVLNEYLHQVLSTKEGYIPKVKEKKINISHFRDIGNMPLGDMKTRDKIYDFWKGIHDKHKTVISAADNLKKAIEEMPDLGTGSLSDFQKALKKFVENYDGKELPNYIVKLPAFKMRIDSAEIAAFQIMNTFDDLRGIAPKESAVDPTAKIREPSPFAGETMEESESKPRKVEGKYGQEYEMGRGSVSGRERKITEESLQGEIATTADASLADPKEKLVRTFDRIEGMPKSKTGVLVDPIFYHKYSNDYSKLKIPASQLKEIKQYVNGFIEKDGTFTRGLKHLHFMIKEDDGETTKYELDMATLEEFDKWFDNFTEFLDEVERDYYLPVSDFVAEYMKQEGGVNKIIDPETGEVVPAPKGELTGDILYQIDDITLRFLESIRDMSESYNTSFSVYQKEIKHAKRIERQGKKTTPAKQYQGKFMNTFRDISGTVPEFMWAGKRPPKREVPTELNKPYNDLLEAINEYYLLPVQGKKFVQAKEKPSWAKGHAALILSIENAKKNPIGSLLNLMVEESVGGVRPKHIRNITKFYKKIREGDWDKELFNDAERVVKALDRLFTKEWHEQNKISLARILYNEAKELDIPIENFSKGYWQNLEKLAKDYEEGENIYPIDFLRHALNTPEFTSWVGLSRGQDASEKTHAYVDEDLVEALTELDAEFDTFHKMDSINLSLLLAHDTIRKMKNKPVVRAYLSLDSIEHMDLVINKVQKEQRIDLTSTEINKIVKAVSSYQSISRDYGINEETVYTIKAMFR